MGTCSTRGDKQSFRLGVPRWVLDAAVITLIVSVVASCVASFTVSDDEKRRCSTCQSNLKEIGVALQVYWNDYDATLPSSMLVSKAQRWSKRDFAIFGSKLGKLPLDGARAQTWPQVLYHYMRAENIMFCPSDPVDRKAANAQTSYWWKCAIDKAWYGVGCPQPCRQEQQFGYNADQIVFYEHNGWHFGQTRGLRNGTRINVAYLDTHVKTVTLINATSGDPVNCAANTNGEPMYFNFDNDQPKRSGVNPPRPGNAPRYTDPGRYSDLLY